MRVYKCIPAGLREEPFEVFAALLCLPVGIGPLFGQRGDHDPTYAVLPELLLRAWGAALVLGGLMTLLGIAMAVRSSVLWAALRGRTVERLGLLLLAWAITMYTFALLVVGGWSSAAWAVLSAAFAGACLTRVLVLQGARTLLTAADRQEALDG